MPPRCLAVIPARYPSTRLPYKPLRMIGNKTVLQRAWEQACKAPCCTEVIIATEDQRILDLAKSFGAQAIMTSAECLTGSDRVAETFRLLAAQGKQFDLVANVQGDMPFINPSIIERTVSALATAPESYGLSTVAVPLLKEGEYLRPSAVKVVLGTDNEALYFSRAPIPFSRDPVGEVSLSEPYGFKHMGLYVFRPETLLRLSALKQSLPEKREKLEQLRALCNGIRIKVAITTPDENRFSIEIDTPEDLDQANRVCAEFDRQAS